jgi:hypothetical protein
MKILTELEDCLDIIYLDDYNLVFCKQKRFLFLFNLN